MSTEAVAGLAPAKVNLYLHVTGRRPDGYHLLDSLVAFADIGDRLEVTAAPEGRLSLEVSGPFAGAIDVGAEDNLVLRAARALRDALDLPEAGAHIRLEKCLPVTAGLGGGSADAAATLRLLQRLWSRRLAPEALRAVALGLGADVPVCLASRPSHMAGIGEILTPLAGAVGGEAAPGIVLVNPRLPLSTPAVFRALAGRFGPAAPMTGWPAGLPALVEDLRWRRNDLQAPAEALCPSVAEILAALKAADGVVLARMSGSGATCFGLCADRHAALAAAETLRRVNAGWWVAGGALWCGQEGP